MRAALCPFVPWGEAGEGLGCVRSEFTSHVVTTTRPLLAGRVSFLKLGPSMSTHRYAWSFLNLVYTAANNNAASAYCPLIFALTL